MCDETIAEYLRRTEDPDPRKRKQALKDLCPCHVRADIPELWERIFQLLSDKEGNLLMTRCNKQLRSIGVIACNISQSIFWHQLTTHAKKQKTN